MQGLQVDKVEEIKIRIKKLINGGHHKEAAALLEKYVQMRPRDSTGYILMSDILLARGNDRQALKVLEQGLGQIPESFELYFRAGEIHERKSRFFSATNAYRQADIYARGPQKKRTIRKMQQLKEKNVFEHKHDQEGYNILIKENKKEEKVIAYRNLYRELLGKKKLLSSILEKMAPDTSSVLEVECGNGVITRQLDSLGLKVTALDEKMDWVNKAWVLDLVEKIRHSIDMGLIRVLQRQLNPTFIQQLDNFDTILLTPHNMEWFLKRESKLEDYFNGLLGKTCRQFMVFLPAPAEEPGSRVKDVLQKLAEDEDYKMELVEEVVEKGELIIISREQARQSPAGQKSIVPHGLEVEEGNSLVFTVDVDKCRDPMGFSYAADSWQSMRAAMEEAMRRKKETGEVSYSDSILRIFFDKYTPDNRLEAWFPGEKSPLPPLDQGWPPPPWFKGLKSRKDIPDKFIFPIEKVRGGNHHFGPNTNSFIKSELERMIRVYANFSYLGYQPEIFPDGYISGYLLKKDNDYTFCVFEGQHRMAALAASGVQTIKVKFNLMEMLPRIVDIEEIEEWPLVANGIYPVDVAEKVFNHYFYDNGRETARKLGIVD